MSTREMLLTSIRFTNFRGLRSFELTKLTPVNLLVGANDTGKSTVLDGIEILLAKDTKLALTRVAERQRKWVHVDSERLPAVHCLFHRHESRIENSFGVDAETLGPSPRRISVRWIPRTQVLEIDRSPTLLAAPEPPAVVVTGDLRDVDLSKLWDQVALKPEKELVIEALHSIKPNLKQITITGLGMGNGFHRLLVLALQLVAACGGYLLVDEIENGIHWSVMPHLWRFLVKTAHDLDVQVFATTHSKDCLEAIANLHRERPELAADISVHRIEAGKETPTRFDTSRIEEYIRMELEAR